MPTTEPGAVISFARELIRRRSITPADEGCLDLIGTRLAAAGFQCERLDCEGVGNLWATLGGGEPLFMFAGHTDVVPPGDEGAWQSPPFEPTEHRGLLYGRGAADMKSSLAAMVVAAERFLTRRTPCGTLAFLLTSDEEGDALYGTRHVVEVLRARGIRPRHCLVGEPSSSARLGDVARNGRRGSLNARLTVHGVQGHVAYPELADNPVHAFAPALAELTRHVWDEGNAWYPPTSLQVANIAAGTGASNVIPGELVVGFNVRFNTEQTAAGIRAEVAAILTRHGLSHTLEWQLSGEPFLTVEGDLTRAVREAVHIETGSACALSTSGGTSDGRFIATLDCEVVELGPVNATIHKVDEHVAVADLEPLARLYERVIAALL
jgi:succinyl-diaminopimelate desuccinylase